MSLGGTNSRRAWIAAGAAVGLALVCFAVVSFLPPHKGQFLDDPIRGFVTGVGVLGVASPLCISGAALRKKFASSPYFEGGFIAGFLNLFGYILVAAGLVCIGFGVYDLIKPFIENR
jgi:hypothetical protein